MLTLASLPLSNIFGFLSVICYALTLLPTSVKIVFPQFKKAKFISQLLKHRRQLGVLAFLLACYHAFLLILKRNIDLLDLQTYGLILDGIATLFIFMLLALTSNDWCTKKMKKNWRLLHQLTYTAMFLLFWHISEKMSGQWNLLTIIALTINSLVIILFMRRRWIENASI
ncbi:ferric reductase domain protein transmembrane component domain [Richelia sinica FACHB-800]|uniref:Ferric reductase domain protein transmembrane component domain n=1 Tax=Richelia sinica FACHB-800 TaxID=1357546 RepID=A0A975TD55_9NOST|nr:ferric reductase-like transmembrane domain-containing protein [Richelia sinica]MBD2665151.1 ferric reductase-like transmembrane domain-containing protein [Richelia sinica FACHB-800]QXE25892.1 ferric reductase domain protein transmembrane component domain [Richelia sinica FACHB-800]